MLANLPYKSWLDGLSEERMANKTKVFKYNNLAPDQPEEREKLLREILGKTKFKKSKRAGSRPALLLWENRFLDKENVLCKLFSQSLGNSHVVVFSSDTEENATIKYGDL